MANYSALDGVFGALADPTRRRIIERLARRSLTVGEIAREFSISQPAISRHLRVLEESGLLKRRIEGRIHHCRLSSGAVEQAIRWLDRQRAYWNAALDRLDTIVSRTLEKEK